MIRLWIGLIIIFYGTYDEMLAPYQWLTVLVTGFIFLFSGLRKIDRDSQDECDKINSNNYRRRL